jgi:hypothetical protein
MLVLRNSEKIGKIPLRGARLTGHTEPADGLAPVKSWEKAQW